MPRVQGGRAHTVLALGGGGQPCGGGAQLGKRAHCTARTANNRRAGMLAGGSGSATSLALGAGSTAAHTPVVICQVTGCLAMMTAHAAVTTTTTFVTPASLHVDACVQGGNAWRQRQRQRQQWHWHWQPQQISPPRCITRGSHYRIQALQHPRRRARAPRRLVHAPHRAAAPLSSSTYARSRGRTRGPCHVRWRQVRPI